jgi:SAM-dependent methyltransferase
MSWPDERARDFGRIADLYERVRPGYLHAAIEWALPPEARDVLDAGVGTGKLSDAIVPTGRRVTAADPDAGMLAVLAAKHPGVPTVVASAEDLPFPDESFDAAVFGQSWHWIDPVRGGEEVGRVLRPGGVLALFWNLRDAREPWVAELAGVLGHLSADEQLLAAGDPPVGAPLVPAGSQVFDWTDELDVDTLVDLAATHGFVLAAPEDERRRMLDGVRALGERIANPAGRITLPYRLHVYRYRKA